MTAANAFDTVNAVTAAIPARQHRPTIEDVAARAGVSVATVSRALRGLPNVAASTRQRIELAATELSYHPDPAAARLAAGRTKVLTIGVPHLNGWYYSNVVSGAERVATACGYEVHVVCIANSSAFDRLVHPGARLERRTDALALVDIDIDPLLAETLRQRGVDVGTIGFDVEGCPSIQIDDLLVGSLAGQHLIDIGCSRVGVVAGLPDDPMRRRVPQLRRAGVEAAIHAAGTDLGRRVATAEFGVDGGRAAMAELLALPAPERPDAVFAMADELAFGVLMELRSRGIPVGAGAGAIAVIGVDDHEFSPVVELSTIRQSVNDHGATLARCMIDIMLARTEVGAAPTAAVEPSDPRLITGTAGLGAVPEVIRPPVALITRGSTAPASSD